MAVAPQVIYFQRLDTVRDVADVANGHLAAIFAEQAKGHPERQFLVFGSRRMTYAQVEREARALGQALRGSEPSDVEPSW